MACQTVNDLLAPVQHSLAIVWVGPRDDFYLVKLDIVYLFVFIKFRPRLNESARYAQESTMILHE